MKHPDEMRSTQRIDTNAGRIDLCVDIERLINEGADLAAVCRFVADERVVASQRWANAVQERQQAWRDLRAAGVQ